MFSVLLEWEGWAIGSLIGSEVASMSTNKTEIKGRCDNSSDQV